MSLGEVTCPGCNRTVIVSFYLASDKKKLIGVGHCENCHSKDNRSVLLEVNVPESIWGSAVEHGLQLVRVA